MKSLTRLMILCITFLAASCAATSGPIESARITLPAQRIFQFGYSFVPPNEEGWKISQRNKFLLSLGKNGPLRNEVLLIHGAPLKIRESQLDKDFIQLIREVQAKDWDSPRYKILKHDVTSYAGKKTTCAHSHILLEDQDALTEAGNRIFMMREVLSLTCIHPKNLKIAINVTYSHRYPSGQRDPQILKRAAGVLNSVEFSDL